MAKKRTGKRKVKKNVPLGVAHIHTTFNNTIVTITDLDGNAITWSVQEHLVSKGLENQHHLQHKCQQKLPQKLQSTMV